MSVLESIGFYLFPIYFQHSSTYSKHPIPGATRTDGSFEHWMNSQAPIGRPFRSRRWLIFFNCNPGFQFQHLTIPTDYRLTFPIHPLKIELRFPKHSTVFTAALGTSFSCSWQMLWMDPGHVGKEPWGLAMYLAHFS